MCVLSMGSLCVVCTSVCVYIYWDVESYVLGGMRVCVCGIVWVFIIVCSEGMFTCWGAQVCVVGGFQCVGLCLVMGRSLCCVLLGEYVTVG